MTVFYELGLNILILEISPHLLNLYLVKAHEKLPLYKKDVAPGKERPLSVRGINFGHPEKSPPPPEI